ncbi:hypothetical protein AVEN_241527-1 [Araneus ventricosus]|uniref:Tc1-like transposase DDE domain-containing protein n=1 Tax=Araneus ventricosus TaxID=182803 RepID=A0A4Y2LCE7_ARAVE|nr:hypothetical protein AVEN_241527-1 [Araneus ventricosus]
MLRDSSSVHDNGLSTPFYPPSSLIEKNSVALQTGVVAILKVQIDLTLRNLWFHSDGAPPHKTSSVKQYLVEEFGEQIIGYGGFQEWPPRAPDLTPMNFFLWRCLKHQCMRPIRQHCMNFNDALRMLVPK